MKFSNGFWLLKEGCARFSPQQIYDVKTGADEVTLCAPTTKVPDRGATLMGVNLTIRITAPFPEVLRIQTVHHMGVQKKAPEFEISEGTAGNLSAEEGEELLTIKSGTLRMEISKENGTFVFWRGQERVTASGRFDLAYMKTDFTGFAYDSGKQNAYMSEQLSLSVGEHIYGLGERFGPFVKNGQSVDIWNEDGGTASEQSYKNIPFYLSDKGYGVFVNHPECVSFEVGTDDEGSADALHGHHRKACAPGALDVRSLALDLLYDGLRREDGQLVCGRDGGAADPAGGVPFRLLLDEGVSSVQLCLGRACFPGSEGDADAAESERA